MYERELIVLPRYRIAKVGKPSFIIKLSECENPPASYNCYGNTRNPMFETINYRSLTNLHLRTSAYGADSLTEVAAHIASYPLFPSSFEGFWIPTYARAKAN